MVCRQEQLLTQIFQPSQEWSVYVETNVIHASNSSLLSFSPRGMYVGLSPRFGGVYCIFLIRKPLITCHFSEHTQARQAAVAAVATTAGASRG